MTDVNHADAATNEAEPIEQVGGSNYGRYVLFVLIIVYIFNFIDRQILSILAEEIKLDLWYRRCRNRFFVRYSFRHFLCGIWYSIGQARGCLESQKSDRSRSIVLERYDRAVGFAQNFTHLAVCRFGVGIGEAVLLRQPSP